MSKALLGRLAFATMPALIMLTAMMASPAAAVVNDDATRASAAADFVREFSAKRSAFEREWLIGQGMPPYGYRLAEALATVEAHLCERMLGGHDAQDG